MELFEYIKSQLPQMPNVQIMKDLGASEALVEYVKESPENTNLNVMGSITNPSGGDAEVWFTGNQYEDDDGMRGFILNGSADHFNELFTNPTNYDIYLDNIELPFYELDGTDRTWRDTENPTSMAKTFLLYNDGSGIEAECYYVDISTAPTSVEVSVKAK